MWHRRRLDLQLTDGSAVRILPRRGALLDAKIRGQSPALRAAFFLYFRVAKAGIEEEGEPGDLLTFAAAKLVAVAARATEEKAVDISSTGAWTPGRLTITGD